MPAHTPWKSEWNPYNRNTRPHWPECWECKPEVSGKVLLCPLHAAAPALLNRGYDLAMLVLQSNRYQKDPDYRDAVDNLLAAIRQARGENNG